MNDDELIRTALHAYGAPEPSADSIRLAIEAGGRRRQRRLLGGAGLATAIVVISGILAVTRGDEGDAIVSVTPTTDVASTTTTPAGPSTTPDHSGGAPVSVPSTFDPTTTSTSSTPPSPSTRSPTASATTTTTTTVPTTTSVPTQQPEQPGLDGPLLACPAGFVIDAAVVRAEVFAAAPDPDSAWFVGRVEGGRSRSELWTAAGRVATIADTFYEPGYDCVSRLRALAYDGRWIWAGIDDRDCPPECDPSRTSVLFRIDVVTGAVDVAWEGDGPILVLHSSGASPALLATGPGASGQISVVSVALDAAELLHSWPAPTDLIWRAAFSPAGDRLAYGSPRLDQGYSGEIRVLDVTTGSERVIDVGDRINAPLVESWSPDGHTLLVYDFWEDVFIGTIDVDAHDPAATFTGLGATACWFDDGTLAVASWFHGYGEQIPEVGTITRRDADGTSLGDLGPPVIGDALVCLDGGRVAYQPNRLVETGVPGRPIGEQQMETVDVVGSDTWQQIAIEGVRSVSSVG